MIKEYISKLAQAKLTFKELLTFVKGFHKELSILTLLNLIIYAIGICLAVITKSVIDNLSTSGSRFASYLFAYLLINILLLLIQSYRNAYKTIYSEKLRNSLQLKYLESYFNIHYSESFNYQTGDVLTRLTSNITNIVNFFTFTLPNIIALFMQLIIAFIIVFNYDKILGVYGFLIMPIVAILSFVFGKRMTFQQRRINQKEGYYRGFLSETIYNSTIIRCFEYTKETLIKTKKLQDDKLKIIKEKSHTVIVSSFLVQLGYSISSFIAFGWGAIRIQQGYLTLGMFFAIIQLMSRMQSPIMELTRALPHYINAITAMERLNTLQTTKKLTSKNKPNINEKFNINIKSLSYSYNREKNILNGFNLKIRSGEKIALIGTSGVGKTTFLKLIMTLLEPLEGYISIEGATAKYENDISFYSFVPQGNSLLSGTVRENLLIGDKTASETELWYALRTAYAETFIHELPNGLETNLGEGGAGLSEGQLQRLCIARALIRKTSILLLDEATSSLDKNTEEIVLKNIFEYYPSKTVIAITHRPTLLNYVDRVIDVSKLGAFKQEIH